MISEIKQGKQEKENIFSNKISINLLSDDKSSNDFKNPEKIQKIYEKNKLNGRNEITNPIGKFELYNLTKNSEFYKNSLWNDIKNK